MTTTITKENLYKKVNLKPAEYKSDQEVRWCPGCGDHAIYNALLKTWSELGIPKEKIAVISGIGCSSRFPYYVDVYGFHGIHGRAGAIASGFKTARPDMSVWQITGDGDALAIGGNHLIHECRRNIDLNIIIFNNEIYGLTKGQYSPTSRFGQVTKTSPYGTIERPFNIGQLVLGANVSFFARTIDAYIKESVEVYKAAEYHKGTSVVEVLQNCVIYNDGAHAEITNKATRKERQIWLKHGEPMIFGENDDKGLILENERFKVVKIGENGITEKDILVHDAKSDNLGLHLMLATMSYPEYPIAMGVIRDVERPTYEELMESQIEEIRQKSKIKTVQDLLNSGNTWEIK